MLVFTGSIVPECMGYEAGSCLRPLGSFDCFEVSNFSDSKLIGLIGDGSRLSPGRRA